MNLGALHRFLAEAVWYPTALLPSLKLRWRAIDDRTANATLTDDGSAVSLDFRFSPSGEVASIYTPARWGTFDGGYKQVPWEGHFRRYARRDGMLVPSEGEVGWYSGRARFGREQSSLQRTSLPSELELLGPGGGSRPRVTHNLRLAISEPWGSGLWPGAD